MPSVGNHKHTLLHPSALAAVLFFAVGPVMTVSGRSITVKNSCTDSVWPALSTSSGGAAVGTLPDAFTSELKSGESVVLDSIPTGWIGRIWGRTACGTFGTGQSTCVTGDCDDGAQICTESGQPSTLVELDFTGTFDNYDVSLVDGFNIPLDLTPGDSTCAALGCPENINAVCPPSLVGAVSNGLNYACFTACKKGMASGTYSNSSATNVPGNRNCCAGIYGLPSLCEASQIDYAQAFKTSCPKAYSFAYDDATSLLTCSSFPTYTMEFCPGTTKDLTGPTAGSSTYDELASNSSFIPKSYVLQSFASVSGWSAPTGGGSSDVGAGSTGSLTAGSGTGTGMEATTSVTSTLTTWEAAATTDSTLIGVANKAVVNVNDPAGTSSTVHTGTSSTVTVVHWVTVTSTSVGTGTNVRRDASSSTSSTTTTTTASTFPTTAPSYETTTLTGVTVISGTTSSVESLELLLPSTNSGAPAAAMYLRPVSGGDADKRGERHQERRMAANGKNSHVHVKGRRWH